MNDPSNSPKFYKGRGKDSHFLAQMRRVYAAFAEQPSTMLQVYVQFGILRANICQYVAEWERERKAYLVHKGICHISKYQAGFYITSIHD
jgi:hypothetical protein